MVLIFQYICLYNSLRNISDVRYLQNLKLNKRHFGYSSQ